MPMQSIFGGLGTGAVSFTEWSGIRSREEACFSHPSTRSCSFGPAAMNKTASGNPTLLSGNTRSSRRSPASACPSFWKLTSRITALPRSESQADCYRMEVVEQKRNALGKSAAKIRHSQGSTFHSTKSNDAAEQLECEFSAFDKRCCSFENALALRGMEFWFCVPKPCYEATARNKRQVCS